jgi:hypothetical protein
MNSRLLQLSALALALAPCFANAVGFGEIVLLSRVGEPLRAEVPILAGAGEPIDTACFSLSALPGSDLPVVSSARTRLLRNGANYRLQITGTRPIAEPIFIIGLRANCGVDLQRDYVLMPPAPLMLADADNEAPPVIRSTVGRKATASREWRARDGDSLENIAESQASENIIEQRRLLAALQRANPGISPEQLLAEGTPVRMPNLRQRIAAERDNEAEPAPRPRRSQGSEAPPARPKKAARIEVAANSPGSGKDRLVLGAPPEELKPGEKAVAPGNKVSEMEERMLKLESTLHVLNQEVDKLNSALTLTTEALAIQNKLQVAQATSTTAESAKAIRAAVATPAAPNRSSQNNWLELLLSAVVGGGIAASMAHYLGRRRPRPGEDEIPLAVSGYRPEAKPNPSAPGIPEKPTAKPPLEPSTRQTDQEVDIPLDSSPSAFNDEEVGDVNYSDGDSALALAEIMLSFGRVRGAAETLALHIEESSPDNIQPWSMLLDLYRRGDMPAEFSTLAERMREKFNVHIPAWEDTSAPVSGLKSLEDYAHIIWRTANSWGKQECLDYLYELVHDTRTGKRSGFPLEVVEEIALLMQLLEVAYGLKRPA